MNYLIGVLLIMLTCVTSVAAAPINRIIGLNADATGSPVPIPLSLSVLCTTSCPLRTSFSFTDANRFWGSVGGVGGCRTSTDGGSTWVACTSQPFVGGTYQGAELYMGASDGSVLAMSWFNGPNTCEIRRSTNLGTSWSLVFSELNACGSSNLEGSQGWCISDGSCTFVSGSTGVNKVYLSTDNGANWTQTFTQTAGNCGVAGSAWIGSLGIVPSQQPGCGGGNIARSWFESGGIWSQSTTWNGTQGDCWGQAVFNGSPMALCQASSAVPDGRYTLRLADSTLFKSLTLPNAVISGIDTGGPMVAYAENVLYVFVQNLSGITEAYVTQDGANNFNSLGTIPVSIRGGNAFVANDCVYATVGAGAGLRFVKICK